MKLQLELNYHVKRAQQYSTSVEYGRTHNHVANVLRHISGGSIEPRGMSYGGVTIVPREGTFRAEM